MSSTMLSIVQDLCARQNIPVPAAVIGSGDPQITQLRALLEEEGNDLAARHDWTTLTYQGVLTTQASEYQAEFPPTAYPGFRKLKNETFWDRENKRPVCGPLNARDWEMIAAMQTSGPMYRYRIYHRQIYVTPAPPAGELWWFEYVSSYWIAANDAGSFPLRKRFEADTDVVLLPDDLCLQGLRWRWKKEKGLDYAEDFRTYEIQVKNAIGDDVGQRPLRMDADPTRGPVPGVFVTPGSWI